jgi:hypothetical protein
MQVNQLRFPTGMESEMGHGFREKNEAFGIIGIIHAVPLIQSSALKEIGLVEEIKGEAGSRFKLPKFAMHAMRAEREIEGHARPFQIGQSLAYSEVQRGDESDLMAPVREGFGQSADHIGKAARF